MSVSFSFKAQRKSSSPEFSEKASFLHEPFGQPAASPSNRGWQPEEPKEKEESLPAERLFRSGGGEPKPIAPKPRQGALTAAPKKPVSKSPAPRPQVKMEPLATPPEKIESPFSVASTNPVVAPNEEPPAAPAAIPSSPSSLPPAAQPPVQPSGASLPEPRPLPATAEEGWRAAELATANREISLLKARESELLERMHQLEQSMARLLSNPPAPDHKKVMTLLDEWMNGHLDGFVEKSVRKLFGKPDPENGEDATEPWFRRKPFVSMTTPESRPDSNDSQTTSTTP